jgi:hypothetical protein
MSPSAIINLSSSYLDSPKKGLTNAA